MRCALCRTDPWKRFTEEPRQEVARVVGSPSYSATTRHRAARSAVCPTLHGRRAARSGPAGARLVAAPRQGPGRERAPGSSTGPGARVGAGGQDRSPQSTGRVTSSASRPPVCRGRAACPPASSRAGVAAASRAGTATGPQDQPDRWCRPAGPHGTATAVLTRTSEGHVRCSGRAPHAGTEAATRPGAPPRSARPPGPPPRHARPWTPRRSASGRPRGSAARRPGTSCPRPPAHR